MLIVRVGGREALGDAAGGEAKPTASLAGRVGAGGCVDAPPPNLWRRVSRCCACVRDGRCNCSTFTLSHRSVASWAARTEPLLGKQLPKNGQVLRRFFHFVRVQRKSVERSGFPRHRGGGGGVEKARIPTQKKSRCVERILRLYASWQNLDRSKKRSAEVDVENRRSFSLALMTLFDIGHAGRLRPHHGGRGSAVPAGPALPRWTPLHHARSRPILGRQRATASGARRAKAVELTGACQTATRSSSGLGAGDEEENGGDDGRDADFVPSAGISAQSASSPKRRRTPIMDAGCRRCVGPHKDLGPHRSSSFHRCPRRRRHSARSTVRRHRRSAREKMAKEIKAEMTVNVCRRAAHHTLGRKTCRGDGR
ncbi:hypothetical protein GWK47_035366 [Chionoecetes opilio]|uniref:Uncharacterized protein n=1 Tax=Chionoecetes opilio TaxID=41210 RepID=A0A8J4YFD8_CHIOP|nr:hypothetical protein GWK47_035366 [Chionoecetes opilio]